MPTQTATATETRHRRIYTNEKARKQFCADNLFLFSISTIGPLLREATIETINTQHHYLYLLSLSVTKKKETDCTRATHDMQMIII